MNEVKKSMGVSMKRIISVLLCIFMVAVIAVAGGCSELNQGAAEKIRDLEFTIVDPEEIPEELAQIIEENRKTEIKMTYESDKYLYLIRGYGEQKTGGYSIAVEQCYLGKNGINVHTNLIGPSHDKSIAQEPSYPSVVVKLQCMEEPVTFQ